MNASSPPPAVVAAVVPSPGSLPEAAHAAYLWTVNSAGPDLGGDYRKWTCPTGVDPAGWGASLSDWVFGTITGPWGLSADTACSACDEFARLPGRDRAGVTAEIRLLMRRGDAAVLIGVRCPGEEPSLAAVFQPPSAYAAFTGASPAPP